MSETKEEPLLRLDGVCKKFNEGTPDETTLFDDYSCEIRKGDFVSVIGSNGSGKTTLINLICGSMQPDAGTILFDGKDILKQSEHVRARRMARVFQDPKLGTCANLTVTENMALADNKNKAYGLGLGVSRRRISHYKDLLLQCEMGLEDRMNVKVGNLSGGQRQAIALIIACMNPVDLLVLDEHTAALDPKSSTRIMELTDRLVKQTHTTTLMVTHNLRFALEYGNRLWMMHQGKCVIDADQKTKSEMSLEQLFETFGTLSIETGNGI